MPTRSRSRSPEREPHHSKKPRPRSLERSRSRDRPRDRTGQDDLRDRRPRSRSRSRDRKRSRRDSYSRSRSPRRRRDHARPRSRSGSRDRRERSRRRSYSRLSSSSGADDDQKRRRKEKSKRRESKERRKERKKEKKDKKKKSSSALHWGKYGIITEVDMFTKRSEFHAWLVEERKTNPETLSKDQERKEFAHFIEDYNTATLPHEKFYNMDMYERRMDALRQGEFLPPAEDAYDPEADMRVLTGAHKRRAPERESYMSREQLEELRKVQNERVQVGKMKLLGMDVKQNMGVRMDGTAFDDF